MKNMHIENKEVIQHQHQIQMYHAIKLKQVRMQTTNKIMDLKNKAVKRIY